MRVVRFETGNRTRTFGCKVLKVNLLSEAKNVTRRIELNIKSFSADISEYADYSQMAK